MAALALITFANVLLRYFTDTSFAWTEEISIFLMIVLAMVGGSSAVARDQHIRIEFFSGNGSAQRRRRLARLGALMTALLFTVLAVLSVRAGLGRLALRRNLARHWRAAVVVFDAGCPFARWPLPCVPLGLFVRQGHPAAFAPEMIEDAGWPEAPASASATTTPAETAQADQP